MCEDPTLETDAGRVESLGVSIRQLLSELLDPLPTRVHVVWERTRKPAEHPVREYQHVEHYCWLSSESESFVGIPTEATHFIFAASSGAGGLPCSISFCIIYALHASTVVRKDGAGELSTICPCRSNTIQIFIIFYSPC